MPLKPVQEQAAIRLARGARPSEVAVALDVTPQTISEWRRRPDFRVLENALRATAVLSALAQIHVLTTDAVRTLADLMNSERPDAVRLRAAATILQYAGIGDPAGGAFNMAFGSTDPSSLDMTQAIEGRLRTLTGHLDI